MLISLPGYWRREDWPVFLKNRKTRPPAPPAQLPIDDSLGAVGPGERVVKSLLLSKENLRFRLIQLIDVEICRGREGHSLNLVL